MSIRTSKLKPKDLSGEWLFTDAGVIPAKVGVPCVAAWAYRHIGIDGRVVAESSGVTTPEDLGIDAGKSITSTLAEYYAVIKGLGALHDAWSGRVGIDSTPCMAWLKSSLSVDRMPLILFDQFRRHVMRLGEIEVVYCKAHPAQMEIARQSTFKGEFVSEHHVACDTACKAALALWMRENATVEPPVALVEAGEPTNAFVSVMRDRGWYQGWLNGQVLSNLLIFDQSGDLRALKKLQRAASELEAFGGKGEATE